MSTIAGAFDETLLNDIRVEAAALGMDERIKLQYMPNYEVLKAIKAVQTAQLGRIYNSLPNGDGGAKKVGIQTVWENFCEIEASNGINCEITCDKSSTNAQVMDITKELEVDGCFSQVDFIDNEFPIDKTIGKFMLQADAKIVNAMDIYAVGIINANKGVNLYTTGKGVVSGTDTYIIPGYWTPDLYGYFNMVGARNQFKNPVILTGANLAEAAYLAAMKQGNANGAGDANLFKSIPTYIDLFHLDDVNNGTLYSYLLAMGSYAMASVNYYPAAITQWGADKVWNMQSAFVPEFKYDVMYKMECDSGGLYKHSFKVMFRGDVWANPAGCDQTNTGTVSFICGTAS